MNDSKAAPLPLYHRTNKRVMVTPQGAAINHTQPVAKTQVAWEAFVVETTTNDPVVIYPTLSGNAVIGSQAGQEITQLYIDKCRFVDGNKPDVELLRKNVNSGIWAVASQVKGTKPL